MATALPSPLVYLDSLHPSILQEIRYAQHHNFVGRPIPGYHAARAVVSEKLAKALVAAQAEASSLGLTLKVYDGYRPRRAVEYFMRWCEDPTDEAMRAEFYPELSKPTIVSDGYLSPRSVHSYGNAVDLTLVPLPAPPQPAYKRGQPLVSGAAAHEVRFADNSLDMGTGFDYFGPASHTADTSIGATAQSNRRKLVALMQRHGLVNYAKEWWHFSLAEPTDYGPFDAPIEPVTPSA